MFFYLFGDGKKFWTQKHSVAIWMVIWHQTGKSGRTASDIILTKQ